MNIKELSKICHKLRKVMSYLPIAATIIKIKKVLLPSQVGVALASDS